MADSSPSEPTTVGTSELLGNSITGELLDWMLAPLVVIAPLLLMLSYINAQDIANEAFDKELSAKAMALAENVTVDPQNGTVRMALSLRSLVADAVVEAHAVRVDTAKGFAEGSSDLPPPPRDVRELPIKQVVFRDAAWQDEPVRIATLRFVPPSSEVPITLQLAETRARHQALSHRILTRLMPVQFLVLGLLTLLAYVGLRRGLQPLNRLSRKISERNRRDLNPVDPSMAPSEIGPLVREFNTLILSAKTESERRQRFSDNAAHQLRTPLAGISLTAELAARSDDPAEVRAALRTIANSTKDAIHSVNQLLMLARAEHPESIRQERVELRSLLRDTLASLVGEADERAIDLGFDDTTRTEPAVMGDRALLHELFANLLQNALRHTPTGGTVTATLCVPVGADSESIETIPTHSDTQSLRTPSWVEVHIEDTGPGIAAEDRERVFERFFRANPESTTGTGLGLSIVREVALAHGGSVRFIDPTSRVGAHAVVVLPICAY